MDNVININRNKSRGHERSSDNGLYFEQAAFLAGVTLTMVVPTIAYCALRGPIPFTMFAFVALTGVAFGVAKYLFFPTKTISRVDLTIAKQPRAINPRTPPPAAGTRNKLAA